MVTDDTFSAFAEQIEREEQERAERKASGGFTFEKTKWTGIPKKGAVVIRALGEAPDSKVSKYTARTYRFSKIKGDDGKEVHVHLPLVKDNPDHVMQRIISKVLSVDWEGTEKKFIYEKNLPEIFDMIRYNHVSLASGRRKYEKGWSGQEMLVMNCLDRNPVVYDWSKENKHSVLLSKDVNVVTDPITKKVSEFTTPGVPAYGFVGSLYHVIKYYKDWRNFDIKIERTGTTTSPYLVTNASEHIREIPADLQPYVVTGPLTDEELSWEQYDLDKLFGITSYTKIYNRLQKSIGSIDLALGTHYLEELKSFVDEEKTKEKEKKEEAEPPKTSTVSIGVPVDSKELFGEKKRPTREPKVEAPQKMPFGYEKLTDEEKSKIVATKQVEGNTWEILYEGIGDAELVACSICNTPSPSTFATCPGCGATF